jgi:hypothetical protein
MDEPQQEYLIRLRALPDNVPATVRLRRLLKVALRSFKLRCTMAVEVQPQRKTGEPRDYAPYV